MRDFLEYIGMIGTDNLQQVVSGAVRLCLAALCGGLIGMERGRKHRPAGLRTHMLVCVAASLVVLTNEQLIVYYGTGDPTRMGAQVISGISFLGAGTILTDRQNRVRGLTTAAGLWASACIGLAIGSGYYLGGILTCMMMLVIFTKLNDVERYFVKKSRMMELHVTFDSPKNLNSFISELTGMDCSLMSFELYPSDAKADRIEKKQIEAELSILLPLNSHHDTVTELLEDSKGLIMLEEL